MATPGEIVGTYLCWSCSRIVPVKLTQHGNLSAPCSWCSFPHYATKGTEHYRRLEQQLKPVPAAVDASGLAAAGVKIAAKGG